MKISATIITLNEEKNISDCLASLDFVDEIIVVDSGSVDCTEAICRSYPKVRFFTQEWLGFGAQKNKAAELANNDWILNIDADERVSDELQQSIITANSQKNAAFRMARENYFGKKWIRYCGWYPDYTYRFYNKRRCRFSERLVHESLEHDGHTTTLNGNLLHFTYEDISDYLRRMDSYSTLSAKEMFKSGRKISAISLLYKPLATFVKMYFLRKGIFDGWHGLVLSVLYSQYTFCKYSKLMELLRK